MAKQPDRDWCPHLSGNAPGRVSRVLLADGRSWAASSPDAAGNHTIDVISDWLHFYKIDSRWLARRRDRCIGRRGARCGCQDGFRYAAA